MITKERLKELIKKGERIWHIQAPKPEPIILVNELEDEWYLLEDDCLCVMSFEGVVYAWMLENLFETKKEAEEYLELGGK